MFSEVVPHIKNLKNSRSLYLNSTLIPFYIFFGNKTTFHVNITYFFNTFNTLTFTNE